jgi:DnaJ-class molecular chaperone
MEKEDFQERIARLSRAETLARRILEVPAGVSAEALHDAWRRACKRYHPDRRAGEETDAERFRLALLAYGFLSRGKGCEKLLRLAESADAKDEDQDENPDNEWGYFLEWRDRFF